LAKQQKIEVIFHTYTETEAYLHRLSSWHSNHEVRQIVTFQVADLGCMVPACPEQQLSQSPILPVVPTKTNTHLFQG